MMIVVTVVVENCGHFLRVFSFLFFLPFLIGSILQSILIMSVTAAIHVQIAFNPICLMVF